MPSVMGLTRRGLEFWGPALLLGLATIGAYGTAYYSIGLLIPEIGRDTGWSTGVLAGAFSLGVLGQGAVALLAGRVLDRNGSAPVLLPSLALGSLLLFAASFAQAQWQFMVAWAAGGSVIGGGLYYNLTMPVTARLYPHRRTAAFSVLTLLGALASPIFYPAAGWLTEMWGWRIALQCLVGLMALCVTPAALLVRAPAAAPVQRPGAAPGRGSFPLAEPAVQRTLVVVALAALANAALLLQQVPAMQAAGLSLAAASGFAGVRGAFQIPGRLILTPLTNRLGVRNTIGLCYGVAATAALALWVALQGGGGTALVVYFSVVGGMSLGLLSPLNGLFQAQVYGDARLGTLSGVTATVASVASAAGAWLSGLLVETTGSYATVLMLIIALLLLAIAGLAWQRAAEPGAETVAVADVS